MTTFNDFLKNLNLDQNPFSQFTTENETEKFDYIFTQPNDYESIKNNLSSDNSMIILGDRGVGKTALIQDLVKQVKGKNNISILITDFSDLEENFQSKELYHFLITKISFALFSSLAIDKKRIKKLDKEEKILLSYLLKNFVPQISKAYLRDQIKKIQVPWYKLYYKNMENIIKGLFNYGGTVASTLADDFISKHLSGLPPITENVKIKEYFPELDVNFEEEFLEQNVSYSLIERIIYIIKKLDYKNIIIFIDRIDEDQRFDNDAEAIANYIKTILTDNKILLTRNLQIVFTTWTTPFNFIKQEIRTQKHNFSTLNWSINDLENVMNKRLRAYSNDLLNDYKKIFSSEVDENDFALIFNLSNSNPRDLWHIFSSLLRTQYNKDSTSSTIEKTSISYGLNTFIRNFNYYEYYPKKVNARANSMDIYSYIELLLKLDTDTFTARQLKDKTQINYSTAQNYITSMEKIGLISLINPDSGTAQYVIRDPKISYARQKGIKIYRS